MMFRFLLLELLAQYSPLNLFFQVNLTRHTLKNETTQAGHGTRLCNNALVIRRDDSNLTRDPVRSLVRLIGHHRPS